MSHQTSLSLHSYKTDKTRPACLLPGQWAEEGAGICGGERAPCHI